MREVSPLHSARAQLAFLIIGEYILYYSPVFGFSYPFVLDPLGCISEYSSLNAFQMLLLPDWSRISELCAIGDATQLEALPVSANSRDIVRLLNRDGLILVRELQAQLEQYPNIWLTEVHIPFEFPACMVFSSRYVCNENSFNAQPGAKLPIDWVMW